VGTALIAIASLFFIHIPQPQREPAKSGEEGKKASVWQGVREGFRYVRDWPGLLAILVLGTLGNLLFNPAFSLLPLLVTGHFGGQAIHLAWADMAAGIGVVLGGLILSAWGGFRRRILTTMMGFVGIGVGLLIAGFAPAQAFWLALGGVFVVGMAISMVDGPLLAVIQAVVSPEMQGRVFTLLSSAAKATSPLSLLIAGPVADRFGVRVWYTIAGVGSILMGVVAFFVPAILHLEDDRRAEAVVDADPEASEAA